MFIHVSYFSLFFHAHVVHYVHRVFTSCDMIFIIFITFSLFLSFCVIIVHHVSWFLTLFSSCVFMCSLLFYLHGFHHFASCAGCVSTQNVTCVYVCFKNISPTQAGNSLHIYQNLEHTPLLGINSPPARWGLLDFMSVACSSPPLLLSSPPPPAQPRPSTHSVLSDLNHDHPRPVFPAGPQPRPSPPSVPCRTSTTTIHAQCSLPDLNWAGMVVVEVRQGTCRKIWDKECAEES